MTKFNLFSEPEIQYLKTQRLARVATVSGKGQPDVVPVAFEFDVKENCFYVGSHNQEIFHLTHKYKNVRDGNNKVALVVDDLESVDPWRPRSLKVYGTAEVVDHNGQFGFGKYLCITPKTSWSLGIKGLEIKEGEYRVKIVHGQKSQ